MAHRTFKPRIRATRLQAIALTVPAFGRFPAIVGQRRSEDRARHRFKERFFYSNTAFPHSVRTLPIRRPLRSREVPQRHSLSLTETRTSAAPAGLEAALGGPRASISLTGYPRRRRSSRMIRFRAAASVAISTMRNLPAQCTHTRTSTATTRGRRAESGEHASALAVCMDAAAPDTPSMGVQPAGPSGRYCTVMLRTVAHLTKNDCIHARHFQRFYNHDGLAWNVRVLHVRRFINSPPFPAGIVTVL